MNMFRVKRRKNGIRTDTCAGVKPDGVERRLVGEIISRYERKGLKLIGLKLLNFSRVKAEELYAVHKGRPLL